MSEVTEAKATIINTDIVSQTELDKWLAAKSVQVEQVLAIAGVTEIKNTTDYKNAKAAREALNKVVKGIDSERKLKVAGLQALVKRVKAETDAVTEKANDRAIKLNKLIAQYDERIAADKLAQLERSYTELAPALVPLVPFSKVVAKVGQKWNQKSVTIGKANKELQEFVSKLAADEQLIDGMPYTEQEREELKADYFNVLDIAEAQRLFTERKEARERYAQLQQEREEAAAAYAPTPEPREESAPEKPAPIPGGVEASAPTQAPAQTPKEVPQAKQSYIFRVVVPAEKLKAFLDAMHNIGGLSGREIKE